MAKTIPILEIFQIIEEIFNFKSQKNLPKNIFIFNWTHYDDIILNIIQIHFDLIYYEKPLFYCKKSTHQRIF
jgi:hypothetical protein